MKANDWMDQTNPRNKAIAQLGEICSAMGLSWSAGEKAFVIDLPDVIDSDVTTHLTVEFGTQRKTFDISTWGPKGVDETTGKVADNNPLPDDFQMPDYGQKLEEGEAPKGDDEV